MLGGAPAHAAGKSHPNMLFVFADQWRADATGYSGDQNVQTPNLDRLATQAVNFTHAVSGCPVCCPFRASLMTGRRPLSHGVFLNDVQLRDKECSIAEMLSQHGYATAYIGKWHLDGHGRSSYIPPQRRQGFEYFKALECTHDYNHSFFYGGSDDAKKLWSGYDAFAQTDEAIRYMRQRVSEAQPFLLMLSWGPPHNPYDTAPERFRAMYNPDDIRLRPNVPLERAETARKELAGYYAHCSALDYAIGQLLAGMRELEIERETIFVFTSDHGDMLHSQGAVRKQQPYDESIRVPLLICYPARLREANRRVDALINTEDLLPTLLGLADLPIPESVEGRDYTSAILHGKDPSGGAALLTCPVPFGEWNQARGGREYRGLRTNRYTYVRTLEGPWLLFDNRADPYQLSNLANAPDHSGLQNGLDVRLRRALEDSGDRFLDGNAYVAKWGYALDRSGTVPYSQ